MILHGLKFLLAGLVCFAAPAFAQDDDFFKKGFAGEVIDQDAGNPLPSQPVPKVGKGKGDKNPAQPKAPPSGFIEGGPPDEQDTSAVIIPVGPKVDLSGIPIIAIDGVINFTKVDHAKEAIKQLTALSEERKLRIHRIYALGTESPALAALESKVRLALLGSAVQIVHAKELPKDIPAKGSPAWVFYTSRGRYLAEGSDALERLTTPAGRLKWPKEIGGAPIQLNPPEQQLREVEAKSATERIQGLVSTLNSQKRK